MKKAAAAATAAPPATAAKDRALKSGNPPKKRESSGNNSLSGGPALLPGQGGGGEAEFPIVIWPEWNEAEVLAEKWVGKHVYEDSEGTFALPRSLRPLFEGFKRPTDFAEPAQSGNPSGTTGPIGVGVPSHLDEIFHSTVPSSAGASLGRALSIPEKISAGVGASSNDISIPAVDVDGSTRVVTSPAPIDELHRVLTPLSTNPVSAMTRVHGADGDVVTQANTVENSPNTIASALDDTSVSAAGWAFGEDLNKSGGAQSNTLPNGNVVTGVGIEEDTAQSEHEAFAGTSKFFQANKHLLQSELMRQILAAFHLLFEQSRYFKSIGLNDDLSPWEPLYPKSRDALPMFNSSGKYAVRLFWLGSWRKVFVDDKVPVEESGRPLILSSPNIQELWPLLITKAILKLASTSYRDVEPGIISSAMSPGTSNATNGYSAAGVPSEQGDFDVLHALKGWLPERVRVQGRSQVALGQLWTDLQLLNLKNGSAGGISGKTGVTTVVGATAAPNINFSKTPVSNNSGPNTRSGTALSQPYCIVLAYRDGEEPNEKFDLSTIPFLYRIIDTKESYSGREGDLCSTQKMIKLRSFFSCGHRTKKLADKPNAVTTKVDEIYEILMDSTESWILFSEFCKTFRYVTIYHGQASFKYVKTVQNIIDPSRPVDSIKIPPILYLPDASRGAVIMLNISAYGRCKSEGLPQITSVIIEPFDWKSKKAIVSGSVKAPLVRVATNGTLSTLLRLPPTKGAFKAIVDCQTSYHVSLWSKDEFCFEDEVKYAAENDSLYVRDIDDSYAAQPAGSWFILFKQIFHISKPIFVAPVLYMPESLQNSACLRIVNNDTGQEMSQVFFSLKPFILQPNKFGYAMLADCRTHMSKPAGKFKLRIMSDGAPMLPVDKPLDIILRPGPLDFENTYVPNKHSVLFRYVLKSKDQTENYISMQLSFSIPSVSIKAQFFDGDKEIASSKGKGIVSIFAVRLGHSLERDDKHASKGRFVLQATVDSNELAALGITYDSSSNNAANSNVGAVESGRPGSRGAKTNSPAPSTSAKKKKMSIYPGSPANPGLASPLPTPAGATPVAPEPSLNPPVSEASWKLRIIPSDIASLSVTKDTEKEDRLKMLKDSWESAQPGRALKARETRESFLRLLESGAIRPTAFYVPPAAEFMSGIQRKEKIDSREVIHGSEIVYKQWSIVKKNGSGGHPLLTMMNGTERECVVYGPSGEILQVDLDSQLNNASALHPLPRKLSVNYSDSGKDRQLSSRKTAASILSAVCEGAEDGRASEVKFQGVLDSPNQPRHLSFNPNISEIGGIDDPFAFSDSLISDAGDLDIDTSSSDPPQLLGKVLTDIEREARALLRETDFMNQLAFMRATKAERTKDKEERARAKIAQQEKIDKHMIIVELERGEDTASRDGYRQRIMKEIEEANARKIALENQKAAELAAMELGAEDLAASTSNDRGKKKGKK